MTVQPDAGIAGDRFLATLVAQHIILVSLHTAAQTTDAVLRREQRVLYFLYKDKNIISFIKCSNFIFQMYTKLTLINMLTFASTTIFDLCIKFKHTLDIVDSCRKQ